MLTLVAKIKTFLDFLLNKDRVNIPSIEAKALNFGLVYFIDDFCRQNPRWVSIIPGTGYVLKEDLIDEHYLSEKSRLSNEYMARLGK